MKKQRQSDIRLYLILFNVLSLCFCFFLVLRISLYSVSFTAQKQTAQNLKTFAHSLDDLLNKNTTQNPDIFLKQLASQDPGFRITLIDCTGTVIGDSDVIDISKLENHKNREEVLQAFKGHETSAVRKSSVSKNDVIYYAIPIIYNHKIAVLRLSMPIKTNVFFSGPMRGHLIATFLIVLSLALIESLVIGTYIIRKIQKIQKAAAAYANGDFDYRANISAPREIAQLANMMETMAQQTKKHISDISQHRNELQAIFSGITEGLIVFTADLTVIQYNDVSRTFFTNTKDKTLTNIPLIEFVRDTEIVKLAMNTIAKTADCPNSITIQTMNLENIRTIFVRCVPISVDSQNDYYLLIFADVTKYKHLEQVRKDFVANVSHELKTPITSIKGFTETLLEAQNPDSETQKHFLTIINTQSARLIAILDDLLTLSRLDQDKLPPDVTATNVPLFLSDICAVFRESAETKQTTLTFTDNTTNQNNLKTALLDPALMYHAIANILDNAIKYCPAESTITCSVQQTSTNFTIIIEDNGTGIPDIYKERIFERFFRVDKGRSRDQGGTGLGLAITYHIIKLHGGTIIERNRPDNHSGARFEITIPATPKTTPENTFTL